MVILVVLCECNFESPWIYSDGSISGLLLVGFLLREQVGELRGEVRTFKGNRVGGFHGEVHTLRGEVRALRNQVGELHELRRTLQRDMAICLILNLIRLEYTDTSILGSIIFVIFLILAYLA